MWPASAPDVPSLCWLGHTLLSLEFWFPSTAALYVSTDLLDDQPHTCEQRAVHLDGKVTIKSVKGVTCLELGLAHGDLPGP